MKTLTHQPRPASPPGRLRHGVSPATRWGLALGAACGLALGAAALANGPSPDPSEPTAARDSLQRFEQLLAQSPSGSGGFSATAAAGGQGLQLSTEPELRTTPTAATPWSVSLPLPVRWALLALGLLGVMGLTGLMLLGLRELAEALLRRPRRAQPGHRPAQPEALARQEAQAFFGPSPAAATPPALTTLPTALTPAMPTLPTPRTAPARYHKATSAELLALAQDLAAAQATPAQVLETLRTQLELPIEPLAADNAAVISITGNSAKGWNEDTALAFISHDPLWGTQQVLMCFDGMGGLRDGKLASKLAAVCMAVELHRTPDTLPNDPRTHLAAAFERVNRRFKRASAELYGKVDGDALRSTAIVLIAGEQHYLVGHQGDGSGFVQRAHGGMEPLFTPHKGAASNMVTHSLGPLPDGEATVVGSALRQPGDLVYIASDGFDPVTPDQVLGFLQGYRAHMPLQTVVEGLSQEAMNAQDAHGPILDDNMSLAALYTPLAVAHLPAPADAQPPALAPAPTQPALAS